MSHKSIMKKLILSMILASIFSICLPVFAFTTDNGLDLNSKNHDYTRIFYFRNGTNARESLFTNYASIDILAPQSYSFNENSELEGSIPEDVLSFAQSKKIRVMPLVTNANFGQKSLASVLNSTKNQKSAIKQMIDEAKRNDYIGWQIDFEQIGFEYKDKFSEFVERASRDFHKKGLILSVAVIAKISDTPSDYKNTLWNDLIGAYDYKRIGDASDFVSIMSYDAPDSKGAVAPYPWLIKVIDYSIKYIPSHKISLGIPLYYWKWDDERGKITGIGGFEGLKIALSTYKPKLGYSDVDKAPYMKYKRNKKSNTIWYENEVSIKEKINLIDKYKLNGFSAWALGLELPAVYLAISK
jgi:spore germination protein